MYDQYLWSVDFSAHWLDGGKLISLECFSKIFCLKLSRVWFCL